MIRKLIADFPALPIRLLVGPEKIGSNDKVNKLCAMARAARHDLLVLSDADIRVGPGYLRSVAAPFRDAKVGAVTSLFTGHSHALAFAGVGGRLPQHRFHARRPDGPASWKACASPWARRSAITRESLAEIGGFEALVDEAADDYELGYRIAARGHRVELVDATVKTWCCLAEPA